jgi:glyoxylase-like metal-dependent hydrolase (beta-lactamase superfamily II)
VLYPEEEEALTNFIKSEGLTVKYHLLTHSHFDHIFGADFVYRTWGLSPCMHKNELSTYEAAAAQMRSFVGNAFTLVTPLAGKLFDDHEVVTLGNHTLKVLPTPGHTQGGVCYYCAEENVLLSGDTLFYRSIGRTDLFGGNYEQLIHSIKQELMVLPSETKVYPGHGPATTIGEERLNFM